MIQFQLPLSDRGPPKPHPSQPVDKWCPGFVRMPHSTHSLYPIEKVHYRSKEKKFSSKNCNYLNVIENKICVTGMQKQRITSSMGSNSRSSSPNFYIQFSIRSCYFLIQ